MIDFHQHLEDPALPGQELKQIKDSDQLCDLLLEHEKRMKQLGCEKVNLIFNQPHYLFESSVEKALKKYRTESERRIFFTFMVDHHNTSSLDRLQYLHTQCDLLLGVKFHSILQNITEDQFPLVLRIAETAVQCRMFIMVDGSYGAKSIYEVDHLKLADYLCQHIRTPVVLAHSGCLKIKEAMLVALERPNANLYFDTSFILSFWKGSSVEQDFAFAIRKLGVGKFFFGSDYPYCDLKEEMTAQGHFFNQNQIPQEAVFHKSAENLLTALYR